MSLLFPALSVLGESAGKILDKYNFNKNRIGYKPLTVITFLVMLALTAAFLLVTREPFPVLSFYGFSLVLLIIVLSTLQNITDVIGLSMENLSLREPISNFEYLVAALIAFFLFPAERDFVTLLLVFIGALILAWANTEHHHFRLFSRKGTLFFILSILFSAMLVNAYKGGLAFLSPAWLFFFRIAGVLALVSVFLRFNPRTVTRPGLQFTVYAGVAYFVGSLSQLFSIQYLGLLTTILLLMAEPALKYLGSYFILKEHVTRKEVIGSFGIMALIIFSLMV